MSYKVKWQYDENSHIPNVVIIAWKEDYWPIECESLLHKHALAYFYTIQKEKMFK